MSLPRTWLLLFVLAGVCLEGQALAQFPFGGPPGGGGGQPMMAEMMERMVTGTVQDVNPIKGYIQVGSSRRSRIVVMGPNTEITQLATVPLSEVAVGEEISVTGVPVAMRADSLLLSQPLGLADILQALQATEAPAESEPEAPRTDQPGGEPPGGEGTNQNEGEAAAPGRDEEDETPGGIEPSAPAVAASAPASVPTTTVAGTVKSLEPFVIELQDGQQLTVVLSDETSVLRRAKADISAVTVDQEILALGDVDQDGYLAAARIYLGESISMGRMPGGRGGFGPPGGLRGGPRGARPGEPRRPSEEEQSG